MRAIVLHSPKDIRLEGRPRPTAGPGEVLVRVASVGVCGSDLPRMLVKGAWKMPLITGHEFSGHIEELGAGVSGWDRGELVAIAMTDPASIAIHGLWKAGGVQIGQTGAVVGCGPIGLFAIQWMRLMGAKDVIAVDVSDEKLALAREAGATVCVLSKDLGDNKARADVVVEAVGLDSTINAAVMLAGPGGHVTFIGIPVPDVKLANASFQYFLRQEISLHGSWNSFGAPFPGAQWTTTLEKFGTGELKWEFMISHDLDLAELPGIFERFDKKDIHFSKVLFRP